MQKIKSVLLKSFFLIGLCLLAADRPKLVKVKITDAITVSIPQGWNAMDLLPLTYACTCQETTPGPTQTTIESEPSRLYGT